MFLKLLLTNLVITLSHSISQHPILIVVSYDAFKNDYFKTKHVENLNRLRASGTSAEYLVNVFPTKTFPNHHSIATGLYAESHGVIANSYYDVAQRKLVYMSSEMFHYNEEVVPIWRRNEDSGPDRYSGVMMWPGGCYPYQGKNVTYCTDFQHNFDWATRIDTVIQWILNPTRPANLIMIYFDEPDNDAHMYGTNSPEVNQLINKLDNITLYLDQQLRLNNLTDKTNVIHLSDHGMINVRPPNFLNLTQYLTRDTYVMAGASPVLQFYPNKGYETDVYRKLKNASRINGHFKVYNKNEYLERWHYRNNRRTPPILVMADVGYALDDLIIRFRNASNSSEFGVHGYDYTVEEMLAFFMARGPKIKSNHTVTPFNVVDLYPLFCEILEIQSTVNNGTRANILDVLKDVHGRYALASVLMLTVGGICLLIMFIAAVAIITLMAIKRRQSMITTAALNKRFPQTFQSNYEAQHLLESDEA